MDSAEGRRAASSEVALRAVIAVSLPGEENTASGALRESLRRAAAVDIFINSSAEGRGSGRVKHTGGSEPGGLAGT